MKAILTILTIISVLLIGGIAVNKVSFNNGCGGHLKRAADANTIDMAKEELKTALDYMEEHDMTHGYTSVFYNTPDEDVKFWYNNVKSSYNELLSLDSTVTHLEKSNMLIKLRETLLDHGDKGESITCPDGISRFPNNGAWAFGWLIIIATIALWVYAFVIEFDF